MTWYGTGGTLLFVMICTMFLQAKDDVERHRKDKIVNSRVTNFYTGTRQLTGCTAEKTWADVVVGDVLVVSAGEEIPADMVILTSSSAEGDCFVETSNIDGESNLKVKSAPSSVHHGFLSATKSRKTQNADGHDIWKSAAHASTSLHNMAGILKCELPNADVYRFTGNVKLAKASKLEAEQAARDAAKAQAAQDKDDSSDSEEEEEYIVGGERDNIGQLVALDDANVLLRGSVLRSTGWVVGVVVYTGRQTKVAMNSAQPPSKLSRMEHTINVALAVVLVAQLVLVVISDVLRLQWVQETFYIGGIDPWYLSETNASTLAAADAAGANLSEVDFSAAGQETDLPGWVAYFFTFFILYNNMVPISMYFTVELCCFVHAMYINRDPKMHCKETNTPARCRSSNLCQEIGQVAYIFADKTGTITRNEMELKCVALADQVFGSFRGAEFFSGFHARQLLGKFRTEGDNLRAKQKARGGRKAIENWSLTANYDFWTIVACCHSAMVSKAPTEDGALRCMSRTVLAVNRAVPTLHRSLTPVGVCWFVFILSFIFAFSAVIAFVVICCTGDNTVSEAGELQFDGESIDETTLLRGAVKAGVKFLGKRRNVISIQYDPSVSSMAAAQGATTGGDAAAEVSPWVEDYEILFTNAFSSSRMRMSIVAKRVSDDSFVLFVKGADEVIGNLALEERSTTHLRTMCNRMAASGLRVLMVAKRELGFKECSEYVKRYNEIQRLVQGRDDAMLALAAAMEKKLTIVGVTGIEDKLQSKVSETIQTIRDANIRMWMLTGDKLTTANTIAFNTNLLTKTQRILYVRINSIFAGQEEQLQSMEQEMRVFYEMLRGSVAKSQERAHGSEGHGGLGRGGSPSAPQFAVVITGPALKLILGGKNQEIDPPTSPAARDIFVQLVGECSVVIACRVSPYQKAQLVELVRNEVDKNALTLAIGDGANDVPMLQKAHIGVGINGHEGMQAANNSDFTIARFKFLSRLLLVHGRWNYRRMAAVVRYSFYKNFVLVLMLFFYSNFTGFSGTTLFDGLLQSGYNIFLFWPIFCVGVFDKDVEEEDVEECPRLYDAGRLGEDLNVIVITSTVFKSILHAGVVFVLPYLAVPSFELFGIADIEIYGQTVFFLLIVVMLTRSTIITNTWNFWYTFWFIVTVFLTLTVFVAYSAMDGVFPDMYGVYLTAFTNPITYVLCVSCMAVVIVMDFVLLLFRRMMCPTNFEQRLWDHFDDNDSIHHIHDKPTDFCCSAAFESESGKKRSRLSTPVATSGIELQDLRSPSGSTAGSAVERKIDIEEGRQPAISSFSSRVKPSTPPKPQHPIYEQRMHLWRPRWSFSSPDATCQLTVCALGWSVVLVLIAILLLLGSGDITEYSFVYSHPSEAVAVEQWSQFSYGTDQTIVQSSSCVSFQTSPEGLKEFVFATDVVAPGFNAANLDPQMRDQYVNMTASQRSAIANVRAVLNGQTQSSIPVPPAATVEDIVPDPDRGNVSWPLQRGEVCHFTLRITQDMPGPVYLLYGLGGFHQNVLFYKDDAPWDWMRNSTDSGEEMMSECNFRTYDGNSGLQVAPCGLFANSLFNDSFALVDAVSDQGDRVNITLDQQAVPGPVASMGDSFANRDIDTGNGTHAQYLHESYPSVVPWYEGIESSRFRTWMRPAPFKSFRKIYARLSDSVGLAAGTNLTFLVVSSFNAAAFNGTKTFIVSNSGKTCSLRHTVLTWDFTDGCFCARFRCTWGIKYLVGCRIRFVRSARHFVLWRNLDSSLHVERTASCRVLSSPTRCRPQHFSEPALDTRSIRTKQHHDRNWDG